MVFPGGKCGPAALPFLISRVLPASGEFPPPCTRIALPAAAQTQPCRARAPYTEPAAHGLAFGALPPAAAGSFHIQAGMPPRFQISTLRLRENRCA